MTQHTNARIPFQSPIVCETGERGYPGDWDSPPPSCIYPLELLLVSEQYDTKIPFTFATCAKATV